MKVITIFHFVVLTSTMMSAQDDLQREIATAAAIQDSVERLAAFDALAARFRLGPNSNRHQELQDRWRIDINTSPIDDSQTVTAMLPAEGAIDTRSRKHIPTLILRYKEGRSEAYITFGMFLGSESIPATVRFGRETAESQIWSVSTDHTAAFYPGNTHDFIDKLSGVDSFVIRVTPFSESPVTISFCPAGVQRIASVLKNADSASGYVNGQCSDSGVDLMAFERNAFLELLKALKREVAQTQIGQKYLQTEQRIAELDSKITAQIRSAKITEFSSTPETMERLSLTEVKQALSRDLHALVWDKLEKQCKNRARASLDGSFRLRLDRSKTYAILGKALLSPLRGDVFRDWAIWYSVGNSTSVVLNDGNRISSKPTDGIPLFDLSTAL